MIASYEINDKDLINIKFDNLKKVHVYSLEDSAYHTSLTWKTIELTVHKNNLYLNKKKIIMNSMYLKSKTRININGCFYTTELLIIFDQKKKKLNIIACVDLEEYVKSVMICETHHQWPLATHQVSAIMIRTFARHKMEEARKRHKIYDIRSTNSDQTYRGFKSSIAQGIEMAANDTKGIILTYKSKPIVAMYDICCGGNYIPDLRRVDFHEFPYLKREKICNYCSDYKKYSWSIKFTEPELIKIISNEEKKSILSVVKAQSTKKTKSGITLKVTIDIEVRKKSGNKKESLIYNNKQIQSLFGINHSRYSPSFILIWDDLKKSLTIEGRGQGHLLGVCQYGMKKMAELKKTYEEILLFYYPFTKLEKIES